MEDIELKNLLENITVEPSARCWQSIEGQLSAGLSGASAAQQAAASASSHSAIHLSSVAAKIMIGMVSSAIVAGGIALYIVNSDSSSLNNATPSATQGNKIVAGDSAVMNETQNLKPQTVQLFQKEIQNQSPAANNPSENAPGNPLINASEGVTMPSATNSPVSVVPSGGQSEKQSEGLRVADSKLTAQETPQRTQSAPTSDKPIATTSITKPKSDNELKEQLSQDPVIAQHNSFDDIDLTPPITLEIPNVITPNSDGYNDFFVIRGIENCEQSRMIIRNRNGNVVFQAKNYQNDWGAANLADGTYYYQFYYTIHGIQEMRTGTLTVLR